MSSLANLNIVKFFLKMVLTNPIVRAIMFWLSVRLCIFDTIKIRTSYDCRGGAALPMTAPVQGDYDGGVKLLEV